MDLRRKNSKFNVGMPMQLVTPNEPTDNGVISTNEVVAIQKDETEKENENNDGSTNTCSSKFFRPSLKSTWELENDTVMLINRLRSNEKVASNDIINVLNKSLMTISHWTLQGQLLQISDKSFDDRNTIETKLAKKEVEVLKNQISRAKTTVLASPMKIPAESSCTSNKTMSVNKTKRASLDRTMVSPKTRIRKFQIQKQQGFLVSSPVLTRRQYSNPSFLSSPTRSNSASNNTTNRDNLQLVENSKPHPRTRRTGDSAAANEYVRVFHLQHVSPKTTKKP